jgi:two-component system, NarL family, response regulator NreC
LHQIRVIVADDHTILREGVIALLAADAAVNVIAQTSDGLSTLAKVTELQPDVLVVDISLPQMNGIEVVRRIKRDGLRTRALVLTMHEEEEYVVHAVQAGASGFLLKDSASRELLTAVRDIGAGRKHFGTHAAHVLAQQMSRPAVPVDDPYRDLTSREREVFHLIIEGMTTKEVAKRLDIAVRTAENHRNHVIGKLDVRNTAELIRYAARYRLLL